MVKRKRDFMSFIKVYLSKYPFDVNEPLYCEERQTEINHCLTQKSHDEKYYIWHLLQFAMKDTFHIDIKNVSFSHLKNGKWTCPLCYFSFSHSGPLLAVALSNQKVGIDIQSIRDISNKSKMMSYLLSNEEQDLFTNLNSLNLLRIFSLKEALFKSGEQDFFNPLEIKIIQENQRFYWKKITFKKKDYQLCVVYQNGANPLSIVDVGKNLSIK